MRRHLYPYPLRIRSSTSRAAFTSKLAIPSHSAWRLVRPSVSFDIGGFLCSRRRTTRSSGRDAQPSGLGYHRSRVFDSGMVVHPGLSTRKANRGPELLLQSRASRIHPWPRSGDGAASVSLPICPVMYHDRRS
ncbi:hypothetical protein GCM10017714_34790 [Curtobacterium pusillum]|nr:hypothetical protein GCM10017610_17720 [Curtobacterium pusillum]